MTELAELDQDHRRILELIWAGEKGEVFSAISFAARANVIYPGSNVFRVNAHLVGEASSSDRYALNRFVVQPLYAFREVFGWVEESAPRPYKQQWQRLCSELKEQGWLTQLPEIDTYDLSHALFIRGREQSLADFESKWAATKVLIQEFMKLNNSSFIANLLGDQLQERQAKLEWMGWHQKEPGISEQEAATRQQARTEYLKQSEDFVFEMVCTYLETAINPAVRAL